MLDLGNTGLSSSSLSRLFHLLFLDTLFRISGKCLLVLPLAVPAFSLCQSFVKPLFCSKVDRNIYHFREKKELKVEFRKIFFLIFPFEICHRPKDCSFFRPLDPNQARTEKSKFHPFFLAFSQGD